MFSITLTPELLQIKSMQNQCKINVKSMQMHVIIIYNIIISFQLMNAERRYMVLLSP